MRTIEIKSVGGSHIKIEKRSDDVYCFLWIYHNVASLNAKKCRRAATALLKAAEEMEKEK